MIIRIDGKNFVEVISKKENSFQGTILVKYKHIEEPERIGELKIKSYDTVNHITGDCIVEVEKIDVPAGVLRTSKRGGREKINVPICLIPPHIEDIQPGSFLNIVMDDEDFVTITREVTGSRDLRKR